MEKMWLVSVIIPVYNTEKYLNKCLDSVINQSYSKLEVILVDDGSQDQSGKICDEYQKKDLRIKVIHNNNSGVSHARNTGLDICSGEFIIFVDSDDYIDENYVSELVKPFKQDNYDLVFCNYLEQDVKSSKTVCHVLSDNEMIRLSGDFYKDYHVFKQLLWFPWLKAYRTDIVKNNNIRFPEDMTDGEDQVFNYNYFENVRQYHYINMPLYTYCRNNSGTSLSKQVIDESYFSNIKKAKFEKAFYKKCKIAFYEEMLIDNVIALMHRFSLNNDLGYKGFKLRVKEFSQIISEELKMVNNLSLKRKVVKVCLQNNLFFLLYIYWRFKH